jgi:hypothetical protein
MSLNSSQPGWILVVQPAQRELYEVLRARLHGSGVEVILERRRRERRRGSLGPAMERRMGDRRRWRPVGLIAPAVVAEVPAAPSTKVSATPEVAPGPGASFHRCPTCAVMLETEFPRFPHPPARIEVEVGHVGTNGQDGHHYVEIAAFTVSGRILLSQRVPARPRR